jgi:hypothetical protein
MIDITPHLEDGVVEIRVEGKLEAADFENVAPIVDGMIEQKGKIKGLLLNVSEFTGWRDVDALLTHFKFVKDHHAYIERVAAVSNKPWHEILPRFAAVFVKAEPRHFKIENIDHAMRWVRGDEPPA